MKPVRRLLATACLMIWALGLHAETLTLGILAFRPKDETQARWQPLADYLSLALPGKQVRLRTLFYPELNVAIARQELDFVLTNPAHYIDLRHRYALSGALATLVENEQGHALSEFGGVIVTLRTRDDLKDLQDLAGKRIALTDASSLGGYHMQAFELVHAGMPLPKQEHLMLTGLPHDKVITAILTGRADAGFVRTGVIEHMAAEGKLDPNQLKILNPQYPQGFPFALSTRLYPEWPLVVLPHVDEQVARRVASALLAIDANTPVASQIGLSRFAVPADYSPIEHLMLELRVPPFDTPITVTPRDIWRRYSSVIIVLGSATGIILLMAVWLGMINRRLALARRQTDEVSALLSESEERLRLAINGVSDGIWDWNLRKQAWYFSPKWKEQIGYGNEELPDSYESFVSHLHPNERDAVIATLESHLRGDTPHYRIEYRFRHKDGSWHWMLARGDALRDNTGQAIRLLGTHTDITERKLFEQRLADSEAMLRTAQHIAHIGNWTLNHLEDTLSWSEEMYAIYEISDRQREVTLELRKQAIHPDDRRHIAHSFAYAIEHGKHFDATYRLQLNNGLIKFVQEHCETRLTSEGVPEQTFGVVQDITEHVLAQEAIRESGERFRIVADFAYDWEYWQGMTGEMIYINPACKRVSGYSQAEFTARPALLEEIVYPDDRQRYHELPTTLVSASEASIDIRILCKNGEVRWIAHSCRRVYSREGNPLGLRVSNRDITDRKKAEDLAHQLAFFDSLTNLPNRRMLLDRLDHGLAQAKRFHRSLAVMFLDLDRFKLINDTLGHDIGDELLKAVALRLTACVRACDTVSRTGGDEFIVVLPEIAQLSDATLVANKILKALTTPFELPSTTLQISTSIGIAIYPMDGADSTQFLMKKADMAMYAAKAAGRGRIELAT